MESDCSSRGKMMLGDFDTAMLSGPEGVVDVWTRCFQVEWVVFTINTIFKKLVPWSQCCSTNKQDSLTPRVQKRLRAYHM